jgi:ketosteroid isomerase-like protein
VSAHNVEIVREAYRAAKEGSSLEPLFELLDPEIVWDNRAVWPDGDRYHGRDEVRREARRWFGTWEEYRFNAEEFIDAGDCVVVPLRVHGRGRGSGAEVEQYFVELWRLRNGRAVEHFAYPSKEEALEAARAK